MLGGPEPLLLADLIVAKCVYVAQAEVTGVGTIVSFDRSVDRIPSVTRREP